MINYLTDYTVLLFLLSASSLCVSNTDAHVYLVTPKPRNIVAAEQGILRNNQHNALNNLNPDYSTRTSSVCGSVQVRPELDMDNYPNLGTQATYNAGEVITVDIQVDVYHRGHFEFAICSGSNPTQACFSQNLLNVVNDNVWGTEPLWAAFPHRAMLPPENVMSTGLHSYQVELHDNLPSGDYVLKMTYVTANSCYPTGYPDYTAPASWGRIDFQRWDECSSSPYNVPPPNEELFHNCVDITINGNGQSSAILTPPPSPEGLPHLSPPTPAPVSSPSGGTNESSLPISQNGACGANAGARCVPGLCCSKWGYCGTSDGYCGSDCQPEYGDCNSIENSPPPTPEPTFPSPTPPSSGQCVAKTQAELGGTGWATTDEHCAPCANGETWWPCNTSPALCDCRGSDHTT